MAPAIPESSKTRTDAVVYIVDDDDSFRRFLQSLVESVGLNAQPFDTARAFLKNYQRDKPSCLLLDVRMPDMSGLELLELLVRDSDDVPVIIMTGYGDVPIAVRAMKNGAMDFIQKPFNNQALLELVERAIAMSIGSLRERLDRAENRHRIDMLTVRERQVFDMVVDGRPNKAIATALSLSEKTVEFHRAKVMDKMQAGSLADLVKKSLS